MSLGSTQPFRPSATVTINAGTSAASALLGGSGDAVLVYNAASGTAFLRFGTDLTVTAQKTDTPVPAGARMLVHAGTLAKSISVLLGSGTGSVYATRGDGTVY